MIPVKYINQIPIGVVRAIAAQVLFLSLLGIYFNQPWIVLFITLDFAFRLSNKTKYSALAIVAKRYVVPVLGLSHAPTGLKPKRFAAGIGFMLTAAALGLYLGGFSILANSLLGVLAFFAFLESALGFCAGCKIYALLVRNGIIDDPECEECKV